MYILVLLPVKIDINGLLSQKLRVCIIINLLKQKNSNLNSDRMQNNTILS